MSQKLVNLVELSELWLFSQQFFFLSTSTKTETRRLANPQLFSILNHDSSVISH